MPRVGRARAARRRAREADTIKPVKKEQWALHYPATTQFVARRHRPGDAEEEGAAAVAPHPADQSERQADLQAPEVRYRRLMPRLAVAVAVVASLASAVGRARPALPRYDIDVRVDRRGARGSRGTRASSCPTTTGAPLGELWLWRYPERFATRSPQLNDYNFYWVYPYRFNPGAHAHRRASPSTAAPPRSRCAIIRAPGRARCFACRSTAAAPRRAATVDVDFETSRCPSATARSAASAAPARSGAASTRCWRRRGRRRRSLRALPGRGRLHG